jgi:hypothetical protein
VNVDTIKKCSRCKAEKSFNDFYKNKSQSSGYSSWCKQCSREGTAKWVHENRDRKRLIDRKSRVANREAILLREKERYQPDRAREKRLARKFGMSIEQYSQMLIAQNGRCAICHGRGSGMSHSDNLSIDHDHRGGGVRGLLCARCNVGIGMFKDDIDCLLRAAAYLTSHLKATAAKNPDQDPPF